MAAISGAGKGCVRSMPSTSAAKQGPTWRMRKLMTVYSLTGGIAAILGALSGAVISHRPRISRPDVARLSGQSMIIANVAGAGGATGSLRCKNAQPDGYTIGFAHMATRAAAVSSNATLPYDARTDFDYLGIHLVTPHLITV